MSFGCTGMFLVYSSFLWKETVEMANTQVFRKIFPEEIEQLMIIFVPSLRPQPAILDRERTEDAPESQLMLFVDTPQIDGQI